MIIGRLLIAVIRVYQRAISPLFPATCRFYPTCSAYAIEAIATRGVFSGLGLSTKRLLKCHPFHPGGVDTLGDSPL